MSSIQARIAALNLDQVGRTAPAPKSASQAGGIDEQASSIEEDQHQDYVNRPNHARSMPAKSPPPLPPARSCTLPSQSRLLQTQDRPRNATAPTRPALPPRETSSSGALKATSPALPPRRPSSRNLQTGSENTAPLKPAISSKRPMGQPLPVSRPSSGRTVSGSSSRKPPLPSPRILAPEYEPAQLPKLPPRASPVSTVRPGINPSNVTSGVPESESKPQLPQRKRPEIPVVQPKSADALSIDRLPDSRAGPHVGKEPPPLPNRALSPPINPAPISGDRYRLSSITAPAVQAGDRLSRTPTQDGAAPDLSRILASKPKNTAAAYRSTSAKLVPSPTADEAKNCLRCRDFSGPDAHGARFPRQTVPSVDWLAIQLTAPFPSATDKARAIFFWLHQNIIYNIADFRNKCIKPSTPASTLASGLAVCEGYAGLFVALAVKAGLEAVVVTGHAKGEGWKDPAPGAATPVLTEVEAHNHAWNAVRFDDGAWHLVDPCWGAGVPSDDPSPHWVTEFRPQWFVMDAVNFGRTHLPADRTRLYRPDGRDIAWEEYVHGIDGVRAAGTSGITAIAVEEGFSEDRITPLDGALLAGSPEQQGTVRFTMERTCAHWRPRADADAERAAGDYQYVLFPRAVGGTSTPSTAMECDADPRARPRRWWLDVPRSELGVAGLEVHLCAVDTIGGRDGHGLARDAVLPYREIPTFKIIKSWKLI